MGRGERSSKPSEAGQVVDYGGLRRPRLRQNPNLKFMVLSASWTAPTTSRRSA
ncbi:MAG: hypothetical protein ACLT2T_14985 [Bilophila wadsworthia]